MPKYRKLYELLEGLTNEACEWQKAYDEDPEEHPDGAEFAKYLEEVGNSLRLMGIFRGVPASAQNGGAK